MYRLFLDFFLPHIPPLKSCYHSFIYSFILFIPGNYFSVLHFVHIHKYIYLHFTSRSCPWVKLMPKFFMGIFFVILLLFIKMYVRIPLIKSFRRICVLHLIFSLFAFSFIPLYCMEKYHLFLAHQIASRQHQE